MVEDKADVRLCLWLITLGFLGVVGHEKSFIFSRMRRKDGVVFKDLPDESIAYLLSSLKKPE